jgi:hypothetical protein
VAASCRRSVRGANQEFKLIRELRELTRIIASLSRAALLLVVDVSC